MVLPGTCHPVLGFHMASVGQSSLERSRLWESRRLSLSFRSLVFWRMLMKLILVWCDLEICPMFKLELELSQEFCVDWHEVSSCCGTVESCPPLAEDLVFATSVRLTRNTAFHPTLFYTELFGNKSHFSSAMLLSTSWKTKMLHKVFRIERDLCPTTDVSTRQQGLGKGPRKWYRHTGWVFSLTMWGGAVIQPHLWEWASSISTSARLHGW